MSEPESPAATLPDHRAFPALDGIRAVAVLFVIATHSAYWTGRYESGFASAILARLDFGVALFFVLSGFLLARPWLVAAATGQPSPSLRVYFWRRGLRILPAYWIAVAFAFVFEKTNRGNVSATDYLHYATLTQIYGNGWIRPGLSQTWSLCTEAAFYLVLPMFGVAAVRVTRRFGWRPNWLLIGCGVIGSISAVFYVVIHATGWYLSVPANFWLPGYLDWFAGGMAMAVVSVHLGYRRPEPESRFRLADTLADNAGSCWLIAAAIFAIAVTPVAGPRAIGLPTAQTALFKSGLYLVAAALLVWPAVFGRRRVAEVLMANRTMQTLGLWSYSLFLFHLAILDGGTMTLLGYHLFSGSTVWVFVVTIALTLPVAWLCFRFIETPSARLRHLVRARTAGSPSSSVGVPQ